MKKLCVKTLAFFTAALIIALCFAGCGAKEQTAEINIGMLAGPTGVGAAKLLADSEAGKTKNTYKATIFSAPDEVTAKFISGELDVAAVPTNLAAVLYKKTGGKALIAALNTLGVLYVVTADGTQISSVSDLKGKTVYSSGQAAVPEYVFDYILDANGIKKDVKVVYEAEHDAVIADLASGKAQIAVLPEPKVTAALMKLEGAKVSLDLTAEFEKAAALKGDKDAVLSMGCVIVSKDFAEKNKKALDIFLDEYEASIGYMSDGANLDDAAALCETYGIIPKAAVAKKAIPNCSLTFVAGDRMKTVIAPFYEILYNYNASSVGGTLPDDGFYYKK